MLTAQDVKKYGKTFGADKVGIAPIERWEGAPMQMDPRQIMPEARSVIGLAFRVMRGSLRGIEEGTFFSNYSSMGYGGLNWMYMPVTVINLAKVIENEGYEAIPYGHLSPWRGIGQEGHLKSRWSRPVEPGRAAPDVMVHLRIAGFLTGLGEIGWSKIFLTPEFGPRQRLGILITEAELEPDPIYDGPQLCDRCMACANDCPIGAIPTDESVKVELAGHQVEWADVDMQACDMAFRGATDAEEDERGDYTEFWACENGCKPHQYSPFYKRPHRVYEYGQAICGARGCMRACMIHLEERDAVKNAFKQPFRRRKPWSVDWANPFGNFPAWDEDPGEGAEWNKPLSDQMQEETESS